MIDLHSHILAGLDDGARDLEESLAIARASIAGGVEAIVATPHVRDDYPTTPDGMEAAVAKLRARLEDEGLSIRILTGGEIAFDWLERLSMEDLGRFGLGGNPGYALIETPYDDLPFNLEERFIRLRSAGVTPVIAHPERNEEIQRDPERLAGLVEDGALVQVTVGSLTGRFGKRVRRTTKAFVEAGLVHVVASDEHSSAAPRGGLGLVAEALHDDELALWFTDGVPRAIVGGLPLPPRPRRSHRTFRLHR